MRKRENLKNFLILLTCVLLCPVFSACGADNRENTNGKKVTKVSNNEVTKENEKDKGDEENREDKENDKKQDKPEDYVSSRDIFAMDTYMTVQAYGSNADEATDKAIEEIERLDGMLSATEEGSEIYELNRNRGGTLSDDVAYLIGRAKEMYENTAGRFNIAIYPVIERWGFASGDYYVPQQEELSELLRITDFSKINFNQSDKTLDYEMSDMKIDLGGIAKGYTSARIMDIFRDSGVTSGIVNLGGNVQVLGTKPDGSDWKVAIQNPLDEENYIGVVKTHDKAVITSGGYERYFEKDGVRYHHIINPDTGYPADSGLISVTIICSDGTMADCLSTALFIMGKDEAINYWRKHQEEFDTILYTEDEQLFVTEGIKDEFSSDFNVTIVNGE